MKKKIILFLMGQIFALHAEEFQEPEEPQYFFESAIDQKLRGEIEVLQQVLRGEVHLVLLVVLKSVDMKLNLLKIELFLVKKI